jgi:hypothetical protein
VWFPDQRGRRRFRVAASEMFVITVNAHGETTSAVKFTGPEPSPNQILTSIRMTPGSFAAAPRLLYGRRDRSKR